MDPFTFLTGIAARYGIDPATLVLIGGVIVSVCNVIGRLIPDDATGWRAVVRKLAKFFGFYLSNRVSAGISETSVAAAAIGIEDKLHVLEKMQATGALPPENGVVLSRDSTGKFMSLKSPALVGLLALFFTLVMLGGCTTTGSDRFIAKNVCDNQVLIRFTVNQAMVLAEQIKDPAQRQIALNSAQTTLDLIAACPVASAQ